jgi:hypothetical protein
MATSSLPFIYGQKTDKNEFIELIKNVPKETNLTIIWDLKYSESFLRLENLSDDLSIIAVDLLKGNELDDLEKDIVIYALQNIPIEKYKYFLLKLSENYIEGSIMDHFVDVSLFPRGWRNDVIDNYKDTIIIEVFQNCLKQKKINHQLRTRIKSVMSGKLRP